MRSSSLLKRSSTKGKMSASCAVVRALAIGATTVGCASSQAKATAATVVWWAPATSSSAASTLRPRSPDAARRNSKPRCTEPYLLGPACRMRRGSPLTGFSGRPCAHSKGRFDRSATARETVQRPQGSCWRLRNLSPGAEGFLSFQRRLVISPSYSVATGSTADRTNILTNHCCQLWRASGVFP